MWFSFCFTCFGFAFLFVFRLFFCHTLHSALVAWLPAFTGIFNEGDFVVLRQQAQGRSAPSPKCPPSKYHPFQASVSLLKLRGAYRLLILVLVFIGLLANYNITSNFVCNAWFEIGADKQTCSYAITNSSESLTCRQPSFSIPGRVRDTYVLCCWGARRRGGSITKTNRDHILRHCEGKDHHPVLPFLLTKVREYTKAPSSRSTLSLGIQQCGW